MAKIPYDVSHVPDLPFGHDDDSAHPISPNGVVTSPRVELATKLERYRLYDLKAIRERSPTRWLIPKVLAHGELTGLYGKGDSFKSFIALDWAMSLAHAGHTVVYIAAEGASGMVARTEAWKKANGVEDDPPGMRFMPANVNLHEATAVERWIEAMRVQLDPERLVLVIIDTLARNFVGGNENSSQDLGQFVEGCEAIRTGLGTAVLVIHHTGKDGETERGGEALRNASFAMFKVTKRGGGANGGWSAELTCDRMKEASPPPNEQIGLKRVALPHLVGSNGEPVDSLVLVSSTTVEKPPADSPDSPAGQSPDEKRLVKYLGANPRANPGRIAEGLKWHRNKVKRVADSLVERGIVSAEGRTKDRAYWLVESDSPDSPDSPDRSDP